MAQEGLDQQASRVLLARLEQLERQEILETLDRLAFKVLQVQLELLVLMDWMGLLDLPAFKERQEQRVQQACKELLELQALQGGLEARAAPEVLAFLAQRESPVQPVFRALQDLLALLESPDSTGLTVTPEQLAPQGQLARLARLESRV